jgi:uncharacterized protein YgbK (DUF1537 family)
MTTILGCIADDFTGATDLAGLIARNGVKVSLRIGIPEEPPSTASSFEVIALKCRTAPVAEAVADCRKALAWLRAAGAKRFFWKYCSTFDSTPDGNIGAVAEALMDDIGIAQTIYCPAFPENGRNIFMGNLFVWRQPLAESPMKDHPLTPMRDSNLMRLLEPQVSRSVGLADRLTVARGASVLQAELARLAADGVSHVVVDAVANEDLQVIAEACRDMPLITGGSALAMSLPRLYIRDGLLSAGAGRADRPKLPKGAIVLSGSCSAMTRAQVARYTKDAPSFWLDPQKLAHNGLQTALDWLALQPIDAAPIVYATAEPEDVRTAQNEFGVRYVSEIVEQALARLALAARDRGTRCFVIAGGETSGAVTRALGVRQLDVGEEITAGVPWTYCESGGHALALALKSGNFGTETFFSDALARLEAT